MPLKKQLGSSSMRSFVSVVCFVAFTSIIMISLIYQAQVPDIIGGFAKINILRGQFGDGTEHDEHLLGGLLASGFDQESCLSRYQSFLYRKLSLHKPSPYLISKLRNYENIHKHCGPYTESYNRTLKMLSSSNGSSPAPTECKYMVWIGDGGLGNRILTMASAFLYALITNRTLLVQHGPDMADLFCEPFPNTSWLLPPEFSNQRDSRSYAHMVKKKIINPSMIELPPSDLYICLSSSCNNFDKLFYCEEHQALFQKVPWMIMKSDEYFTPSLFLITSFEQELSKMFPDKETVFHHLGRYLLHPSNKAWGLITRFYQSYLAKADERIGIQIRLFQPKITPFQVVMDQILACSKQENLLPEVDKEKLVASTTKKQTSSKAILIASLYPVFYENIKNMYWIFPTTTGEKIEVYQPSHEEYQHFDDNMHNIKAWVEMNLLSSSDVLVTSSWSTFGYVAQGLGGLNPWILHRTENWKNTTDPPCCRVMSMEPCLHLPPSYDCKTMANADMGNVLPYVKHCEDATSGLKLVNNCSNRANVL